MYFTNMSNVRHFLLLYLSVLPFYSTAELSDDTVRKIGEKRVSEYVLPIIEHYKQKNPVGLPGAPIPEPMFIPPMSQAFSVTKMRFENMKLYGLSKFHAKHINVDLAAMQVNATLDIDVLYVYGNYTLSTWLSRSQGPFTVKLIKVSANSVAKLQVQEEGKLTAEDIKIDLGVHTIEMQFENLGILASVLQGLLNSVSTFMFDSIKPFILSEANTNIRTDVNEQLKAIPQTFPNSISPIDQLISEARKRVRLLKYDPFKINDYNYTSGIFGVQMTHTWISGLSSFHRVGDIAFDLRNNTIYATLEVGTQRLEGSTHWEVNMLGNILSRLGTASFSVQYVKVKLAVSQTLDTRNSPVLENIQFELGNIQVTCDGAGTLDYLIEFSINILPNLLRYQIMDAIEPPIKSRIQAMFDKINVEQVIKENLPKLDEQQKKGFREMFS